MTISTQPTTTTISADATPDRTWPAVGRLLAYGVGSLTAVGLAALMLAGPAPYQPGTTDHSAYSRPTTALGGQSLAAYIAAHQAARLPANPS